ncbi:MAG: hypothetical protein V4714_08385 [Bacteroidota bacterium]
MSKIRYTTKTYTKVEEIKQAMIELNWKEGNIIPALSLIERGEIIRILYNSKGAEAEQATTEGRNPPGKLVIVRAIPREGD